MWRLIRVFIVSLQNVFYNLNKNDFFFTNNPSIGNVLVVLIPMSQSIRLIMIVAGKLDAETRLLCSPVWRFAMCILV